MIGKLKGRTGLRTHGGVYRHTLRYTGVFGGVQGLKIMMDVARNKLAAMLLHRVGVGLNAVFMNMAEVVNSLTNFGIGFSAVQKLSELYGEGSSDDMRRMVAVVRSWSLLAGVTGLTLCASLSVFLERHFFAEGGDRHTVEIVFLSLYVASLPVEAGECSILKGARLLRSMARVEVLCTFSTFIFTIPVFFLMGLRGIVPSLVLCGWAKACLHLWASTRVYPYRVHLFSGEVMRAGKPLIAKGLPYMLAAIAGGCTTMVAFRHCLGGDADEIGLYKAGYGLMVTYAGLVFMAMEADYFPRLSSVNHDTRRMNLTINRQIDVCVLLVSPLLMAFVMVMPWAVRLLYTSEFLPVVGMAQCAAFYMFFGAVTKPVAYTSLAKGDSGLFLGAECIYNAVFVVLLYLGHRHYGILGAGVSLSLAGLFDLMLVGLLYGRLYRFRLSPGTLRLILPQGAMLLAVVIGSTCGLSVVKYAVGMPCLLLSVLLAWRVLAHGRSDDAAETNETEET